MSRILVDLTSLEMTQRSIVDFFGTEDKTIFNYILGRDRGDLSVDEFLRFSEIVDPPFRKKSIEIASLHVTTNDDGCETIKQFGIVDLQKALTIDTPLKMFLEQHGISFNIENYELVANGSVYNINWKNGKIPGNQNEELNHIGFKVYRDYPIWGFLYAHKVFRYGGYVHRRPEILHNLSVFLGKPEMENDWEIRAKTYIVKFSSPIEDYELPSEGISGLGKILLRTYYDYFFHDGPIEDGIALLHPDVNVSPSQIYQIFSAEEFKVLRPEAALP